MRIALQLRGAKIFLGSGFLQGSTVHFLGCVLKSQLVDYQILELLHRLIMIGGGLAGIDCYFMLPADRRVSAYGVHVVDDRCFLYSVFNYHLEIVLLPRTQDLRFNVDRDFMQAERACSGRRVCRGWV